MRRVYLVDDHPMLLEGLGKLIERIPQCELCGQSTSGADALTTIPSVLPDIVITDISLPDKNGLELIKDLHAILPELKILVFSMHDEMIYAARTLRAGSKGYLI